MKDKRPANTSKLEKQICFILMKAGVTGPEIDECMEWGFGKDPWTRPPYPDWIEAWKILHPQFPVKKKNSFVEWIAVVGFLFCEQKHRIKKAIQQN